MQIDRYGGSSAPSAGSKARITTIQSGHHDCNPCSRTSPGRLLLPVSFCPCSPVRTARQTADGTRCHRRRLAYLSIRTLHSFERAPVARPDLLCVKSRLSGAPKDAEGDIRTALQDLHPCWCGFQRLWQTSGTLSRCLRKFDFLATPHCLRFVVLRLRLGVQREPCERNRIV